jgi:CMP-N-acetylneuraminic acid synthetase
MKIYAIVPIKHTSTRVPGKNFRLMNGKPLYYWIIRTLISVNRLDKIIIDTNSEHLKKDIWNYFHFQSRIVIYDRPEHLWPGDTSTNVLLKNIITDMNLDADYYLQTHVTNPLLKKETIENAIDTFLDKKDSFDSLFSAKTLYTRLYTKDGKDMNHDRKVLIPTQDLDPIYDENSCMYIFSKESLFKFDARIGDNALIYPMSTLESQDIDWEDDFIITELIMKQFYR